VTAPVYAPLSQPPPPSPLDSAAHDFAAALRAFVAAAVDANPSARDAIVSRGQAIHADACAILWHGGAR
jgi:mono/diheme cytochrome c family protein